MEEQHFTLSEILLLQLLLGSITYLIGSIAFFFLIKKLPMKWKVLAMSLQFSLAVALSMVIWRFWPFPFDIMVFDGINLPALLAELIFLLPILIFQKRNRR